MSLLYLDDVIILLLLLLVLILSARISLRLCSSVIVYYHLHVSFISNTNIHINNPLYIHV